MSAPDPDVVSMMEQSVEETQKDNRDKIAKKVEEAAELEIIIADLEALVKAQKDKLSHLKRFDLPDLFTEFGMTEFKSEDGVKVKIDGFMSGSLPKEPDKKKEAIEHLEEIGGGGLIKDKMEVLFEKSQHNSAMNIAEQLKADGYNVDYSSGVHTQSLWAFAREKLKDGSPIDTAKLGIFSGKVAKITMPKKDK